MVSDPLSDAPPPAGWYEDPSDSRLLRLWDGISWTHDTLAKTAIAGQAPPVVAPEAGLGPRLMSLLAQDREAGRRSRVIAHANRIHQEASHRRALEQHLSEVEGAAARGEILEEEKARRAMLAAARNLGGVRVERVARSMLESAERAGRIRIGSTLLGVVKAEGLLSQYARKESLARVRGGGSITVYSDRIFRGDEVRVLDEFTTAQVYLDGVEQITQRPTLTRMALLSPLPGSALIPGLALQKKRKHDMRHAEFLVGARDWSYGVPVSPDALETPRRIAQMINSSAEARAAATTSSCGDLARPELEAPEDLLCRLERLVRLFDQGAITAEEFAHLKSVLIEREGSK